MFLSVGYITSNRTKPINTITFWPALKYIATNLACKCNTTFTNFLTRGWFVHDNPTFLARAWRYSWIRQSFCAEQFGVIAPIFVVCPRVTRFTQGNQIAFGIGGAHVFEKAIRNYMVTIKFVCATTMLARVMVARKNFFGYFAPVLATIRCLFHRVIIAQSGGLSK